jgi:hypothetical protein
LKSAKLLKYLEFQRPCDATFFFFLISWPYTRHYLFNLIILSAYFDAPEIFHRETKTIQTTIPTRQGAADPGATDTIGIPKKDTISPEKYTYYSSVCSLRYKDSSVSGSP